MDKVFGMFDGLVFWLMCFIPGKILVTVFGFGKYVTSLEHEISDPFGTIDLKRRQDGKTIVSYDLVCWIGFFFWLFLVLLVAVGYYSGSFDLVTPLRAWLFGVARLT